MDQQEIEILVKARDEASAALNNLSEKIDGLSGTTTKAQKGSDGMFASFVKGGIALDVLRTGFHFVTDQITGMITQAAEAESGQAQLAAVLQSTGGIAGVTADDANRYAESLSKVSIYSKDTVLQGEDLLLTFTNVHKNAFPQVTQTAADMASALHQDLGSAIEFVGAALQDPITGISRLKRAHIELSPAQQQTIEDSLKAGDMFQAQTVILDALSTRYGGSAAAAANTYAGRMAQLGNTVNEVKENIGRALLPTLEALAGDLLKTASNVQGATNDTENLSHAFYRVGQYAKAAGYMTEALGNGILVFGTILVGGAEEAVAFGQDVWESLSNVGNLAKHVFSGLGNAMSGDFKKAADEFAKVDFSKAFTFATDHMDAAVAKTNNNLIDFSLSAKSAFDKAGDAMVEAMDQKGFKKLQDAAKETAGKLGPGGYVYPAMQAAAGQTKEQLQKAANDFKTKMGDMQTNLGTIVTDFVTKSSKALDDYKAKVADIQAAIAAEDADYSKAKEQRAKDQHAQIVAAFITEQDKLKQLSEQQAALQNTVNTGNGSQKDFLDNQDLMKQLTEQNKVLDQFRAQNAGIEADAAAERKKTSLDKLNEQFAAENQKAQEAHLAKMADLHKKLDEEVAAYQEQKTALLMETQDKYAKLNKEVQAGWQKMIDETKGKVAEMKALEASVLAIKASIAAAQASTSAQSAVTGSGVVPAGKKAAGGPVEAGRPYLVGEVGPEMFVPNTSGIIVPNDRLQASQTQEVSISVMAGAQITVAGEADEDRLAKKVATTIARALQAQRNGLSTAI